MTDPELLELAAALAREAARAILGIRARGFAVERKPDASPVTEADRVAEAIIVAGLRRAAPHIAVVAEEEFADGAAPMVSAGPEAGTWLVDPLDGTRGFAEGRDEFAVCIGLVRTRRPVLGAVAIPATGELFGGLAGRGAWKETGGVRRPIRARPPPEEGLAVLASRHHGRAGELDAFLAGRRVASVAHFGSALKFCRVAEGAADLYVRFGPTMEWDSAAPQAVVEAAGGRVRGLDGVALGYGKPGWRNPGFFCAGLDPASDYAAMAADEARERDAVKWTEALPGDVSDEPSRGD